MVIVKLNMLVKDEENIPRFLSFNNKKILRIRKFRKSILALQIITFYYYILIFRWDELFIDVCYFEQINLQL